MTFTTQKIHTSVTYTEPTGAGSTTFDYWVVDGTTAVENAAADARVAEQFKNMTGAGTVAITAHSVAATRAYTPLTP